MGLGSLTNSRKAGIAAFYMCKFLPPRLGYRLADAFACRLASNSQLAMVQGIRLNQWGLSRCSLTQDELNQSVLAVMRNITRAFYEQFFYLHRLERLRSKIVENDVLREIFSWEKAGRGGLLVCGLHMCSFDLVYQAITLMGLKTIGLSLPHETEAIAWQHKLRRKMGGVIIPATMSNLKHVIRRLQAGEIVVTGIDRPVEDLKYHPRFFDLPAHLPVHYIQLALTAKVPVLLMASFRLPDGRFEMSSSDIITLRNQTDRNSELIENAERILELAEKFILKAPEQWTIIHPIWPELATSLA
ncbi:MAG: hypothetical protein A2Z16_13275 [Chloroflexi bacterium RBG_16_54_18]|nr:MAG: hypothetical protein A2Z16_13275 [Chloroflexi bacterium RBG_16_54_18]